MLAAFPLLHRRQLGVLAAVVICPIDAPCPQGPIQVSDPRLVAQAPHAKVERVCSIQAKEGSDKLPVTANDSFNFCTVLVVLAHRDQRTRPLLSYGNKGGRGRKSRTLDGWPR